MSTSCCYVSSYLLSSVGKLTNGYFICIKFFFINGSMLLVLFISLCRFLKQSTMTVTCINHLQCRIHDLLARRVSHLEKKVAVVIVTKVYCSFFLIINVCVRYKLGSCTLFSVLM